ncbi:MAG: acyltransferase family protein [Paludibacteraceae bacterium]
MQQNCFDFLRFLFAFIVVVGHTLVLTQIPSYQVLKPFADTMLSVTGFFIISGFLISRSYKNSTSLASYFAKRAKRLLPAYVTVIMCCALAFCAISSLPVKDYFSSDQFIQYIAANLSFLNFLQPCLPGVFDGHYMCAVDGALWTLKIEIGFYLLVPLLIYLMRKCGKYDWLFMILIYISAIVYRHIFTALGEDNHFYSLLNHQLPAFMSYFVVGMFTETYFDLIIKHKNKWILPALLITAIEYYFEYEYLFPLTFGLIIIYCAYSLPWLNNFGKYGDISYGIYIWHFPIIQLFIHIGLFDNMPIWLAFAITILCVLAMGWLSWNLVEKHFLKYRSSH